MKVKYCGPKAKHGVPLPIGTRRKAKEFIFFNHGEVKELSEEQGKALIAINTYYSEVSDTGVLEVEAVTTSDVPSVAVQPSPVAPISVPKRRGRPKKVE